MRPASPRAEIILYASRREPQSATLLLDDKFNRFDTVAPDPVPNSLSRHPHIAKMVSIVNRMRKLQTVSPPSITRPIDTNQHPRKYISLPIPRSVLLTPPAPSNKTGLRRRNPPERRRKNPHALRTENRRRTRRLTQVLATRAGAAEIPQPCGPNDDRPKRGTGRASDHDNPLHIRGRAAELRQSDRCARAHGQHER